MRIGPGISGIVTIMLASVLLGSGCAGRSAPSEFYTLSALLQGDSAAGVSATREDLAIGVGPASFPEFLDRPQIVTRTSAHRLHFDEFHRWGGLLQSDFLLVLGENLSTLLGTNRILVYPAEPSFEITHRVVLAVQAYEGTLGDGATLSVRWAVVEPRSSRALVVRQSRITETVSTSDYEALVTAQSRTLAALSREIAEAIAGLAKVPKR